MKEVERKEREEAARERARKIIRTLRETIKSAAQNGNFSTAIMTLKYQDDFLAPRETERAAKGSFHYIFNTWLIHDSVSLAPEQLCEGARMVYNHCKSLGLRITFAPEWETRNYCEGEPYERDRVFNMILHWGSTKRKPKK